MLTLAEEIVLLVLDDSSGKFVHVPEHSFRYALSGAVLMELAFLDKVDTDPEKLFVLDSDPTGDDLLDPVLKHLAEAAEHRDVSFWIQYFGRDADNIRKLALRRLCDAGVLKVEDDLFLWVFKTRRYPNRDGFAKKEVKQRIVSLLFSNDIPDPRDIAIIGLADACRIFQRLFSRQEYERVRDRIAEIRQLELIGQTVSKAVREIELQLAQASAIGPM